MSISQIDPRPVLLNYEDCAGVTTCCEPVTTGFSGAGVYHIRTREPLQRDLCIRCWPVRSLPSARIRGLHRLLDTICTAGTVPVAAPLTTRHGDTLCEHGGRRWQLEPWLPGSADYHARPSHRRLEAVMRALADWHRAARDFSPRESEREWFFYRDAEVSPAVYERLQQLRSWTERRVRRLQTRAERHQHSPIPQAAARLDPTTRLRDIVQRAIPFLELAIPAVTSELQRALSFRVRLQPCLRDVWHDHILFDGDAVSGIIDPSAARGENVATDLARLLGSLVGDSRSDWHHAIAAYRRHHALSATEEALAGTLDQSGTVLSLLNWMERTLETDRIAVTERIVDRCEGLFHRLQNLGSVSP